MKVVITGGAGFIGRHLVAALAARGDEVTTVGRRAAEVPGASRALAADVTDAAAIGAALAGAEAIVHLAGLADASRSAADPVGYTSVNALGTLNVLEAARAGGAALVFASSQRVYEPWRGPLHEDAPLVPTTVYGWGKLTAETLVAMYGRSYGVPAIILRLFTVYGPGQRAGGGASGVVPIFAERALGGRELVVHQRHLRDFVYVTDVAAAFVRALDRAREPGLEPARPFNIGTGVGTALDDLARLVWARGGAGGAEAIREEPTGERREEVVADIARARAELGYAPATPLAEGLGRYLDWLREQLHPECGVRSAE